MKNFILFVIFFMFIMVFSSVVVASEIELIDGSVIIGDVKKIDNEGYTIHSVNLGTLKIDASRIREIRNTKAPKQNKSKMLTINNESTIVDKKAFSSQVESLQQVMISNPQVLNKIMALKDDAEFQSIMQNQDIMNAVQSGDLNYLMNNSKFMRLLDHSAVQQIKQETGVR